MDERAIASKRQHANGRQPSMKRRSDLNDYHGRHVYMLTLAVEGRRPLLGEVLGDPSLPPEHRDAPHVHLTPLGQEVMRCWGEIPRRHPEVQVLAFQVMPDHLHGILFIKEEMEQHLGQVVSGFKAGCNKAYRRLFLEEAVPPPTPKGQGASASSPLAPCASGFCPSASSPSAPSSSPSGPCASGFCPSASSPLAPSSCPSGPCASGFCPSAPSPSAPSSSPSGPCASASCASASSPSAPSSCPSGPCPLVSSPSSPCPSGSCPCPSGPSPSLLSQGAASPLPSPPPPSSLPPSSLPLGSPLPLPSEHRLKPDDRRHGLLFERGYNDLIARGYDMLPRLIAYVHDNPRRLLLKRQRPEWLRPFFGLKLGGETFNGIGNLSLLLAPLRKAVRVSRRLTESEVAGEEAAYLAAARAGTVLISPAISPGEKRVMRSAFGSQLPTVVVVPNGFTPFSKPHGEQFDACVAGRLLMLSPWPHHNEKQPLTRAQCNAMNVMALRLSQCTAEEVRAAVAAVVSQP